MIGGWDICKRLNLKDTAMIIGRLKESQEQSVKDGLNAWESQPEVVALSTPERVEKQA